MPKDLREILERISYEIKQNGTTREAISNGVLTFAKCYRRVSSPEEKDSLDREVFEFLKSFVDPSDFTAIEYFRGVYDREKEGKLEFNMGEDN
jgi:hypothetical protein